MGDPSVEYEIQYSLSALEGYHCMHDQCHAGSRKVLGCNLSECGVNRPRCPVCQFTFMDIMNQVCNGCKGTKCTECGNITQSLIRVDDFSLLCFKCFGDPKVHEKYNTRERTRAEHHMRNLARKGQLPPRKCARCKRDFTPNFLNNTICRSCLFKEKRGFCHECGKKKENLNNNGICLSCEEKIAFGWGNADNYFCACGVYQVDGPGVVCNSIKCIEQHNAKRCPTCAENPPNWILPEQSMCPSCTESFEDIPF